MGAAGLLGALTRPSATLSQRERGWVWDGSHRLRPPAKQAVSKRQFPGTKGQSVIPAKAGIQGRWRGATAPFPRSTPPGFPLSRVCQNCPLSLWERVGVREPRREQAGVNGNELERQGYWGPSPGLRPPSPRGRRVGFGTGRTAFGHPRNRLCQNASSQVRKANPSFPRKRESRGGGGVLQRRFPAPPRLDSRFRGCVKTAPSPSGRGLG